MQESPQQLLERDEIKGKKLIIDSKLMNMIFIVDRNKKLFKQ